MVYSYFPSNFFLHEDSIKYMKISLTAMKISLTKIFPCYFDNNKDTIISMLIGYLHKDSINGGLSKW